MPVAQKLIDGYKKINIQVKVVLWFTFASFLQKGISVITTPIFTRVLSTEDYGLFSVFSSWYMVASIVATLYLHLGVLNNAFIKMKLSKETIVSVSQSLSLIVSVFCFILCFVFRKPIADFIALPEIVVVVAMFGLIFIEPYRIWLVYKRYKYEYKASVLVTVLVSFITPIVSVIAIMLIKHNQGVVRIITYVVVNTILPGIIFYIINYVKGKKFFHKELWKYSLTFNIPLIPHFLAEVLLNQIDKIMINIFYGASQAGIYGVAYSVASLALMFTTALNTAFTPWHYQKLSTGSYEIIAKVTHTIVLVVAVISGMFMLLAPEIVMLMAGQKYMGAVYLIPALCAGVFFGYMYQIYSRVELYYEKKLYTVISTVSATVVNFLLNIILLPKFGYLAAGFSSLVSHIMFFVLHSIFYKKVCKQFIGDKKIYSDKFILTVSGALLIFAALVTLLYQFFIARMILAVGIVMLFVVFKSKFVVTVKALMNK